MSLEMPKVVKKETENKREKINPQEAMHNIIYHADSIMIKAKTVLAFLEKSKSEKIDVNIDDKISEFGQAGEVEKQLIDIWNKLGELNNSMFEQGVKMDGEELRERLNGIDDDLIFSKFEQGVKMDENEAKEHLDKVDSE